MKRFISIFLAAVLFVPLTMAQMIPIKTVPVAEGNQFLFFPSRNLSMGSVSVALEDPLLDPFVNPARGIFLQRLRFTSAPVYYGFAGNNPLSDGSGRTLPVGMFMREGKTFGGGALVWQEITSSVPQWNFNESTLSDQNVYGFVTAGLEIPGTNLSIGFNVLGAQLHAMEGVRLLYASGSDVEQSGSMAIFRGGLLQQWDNGHTADLTVAHHRFDMRHVIPPPPTAFGSNRIELDETRGWAVALNYRYPLAEGWRVGALLAGDWKWHPRIPNYDLMQIPRDPGRSGAYQVGIGTSRQVGAATYGIDLIFEPIRSHTWANAIDTLKTVTGNLLSKGDMTVENFFRFTNTQVRMGVHHVQEKTEFSFGLNAHAIRYNLDQENFVLETTRSQDESWIEWTLSAGFGLIFPEFQIRYLGLLTLGTGIPGTNSVIWATPDAFTRQSYAADFLVAPNGRLFLQEMTVFTHQISIVLPLVE